MKAMEKGKDKLFENLSPSNTEVWHKLEMYRNSVQDAICKISSIPAGTVLLILLTTVCTLMSGLHLETEISHINRADKNTKIHSY